MASVCDPLAIAVASSERRHRLALFGVV